MLHEQINRTVDESLESTRRIRQLAEETEDVAIKTTAELDHQGEKLRGIEGQLDTINEDMKKTEKTLNQMDKFLGLFRMPKFGKKNKVKPSDDGIWKAGQGSQDDKMDRIAANREKSGAGYNAAPMSSGPIINRITNDDREDEMDENLQAVGSILGNLKNMALDMGVEIDSQNQVIERLTYKTDAVDNRVQQADKRVQKKLG